MAKITEIQWADSTVNMIMGCGGCELFPPPKFVCKQVAIAVNTAFGMEMETPATVQDTFERWIRLCGSHPASSNHGHFLRLTTSNIYHLRHHYRVHLGVRYGKLTADAAIAAIEGAVTCYAARLHLAKASNIADLMPNADGSFPDVTRSPNKGYANVFEGLKRFPGRVKEASKWKDLQGSVREQSPWKERLPRMIFLSDMGDSFTTHSDFEFLKEDTLPHLLSDNGKRHLWLWLTKRPHHMAEFSNQVDGLPANVCAMTTLTGPDPASLKRLRDLKRVKAGSRGLSIEPLWDRIPPDDLDLSGIDWVILGGESGKREVARPFPLEWAEEMREHCRNNGVAFFLKQLGRNPTREGRIVSLKDNHGGEWDEWPDEHLKVREFPRVFHDYRSAEMPEPPPLPPTFFDLMDIE